MKKELNTMFGLKDYQELTYKYMKKYIKHFHLTNLKPVTKNLRYERLYS